MNEPASDAPASPAKKTATVLWAIGVSIVIVGCLGAIAGPKFATFGGGKCRALQSEAKTNLSGLFTAQKVFFAEYEFYTTDLVALNWTPEGSPRYAYGFVAPSETLVLERLPDYDPTRRTTVDSRVSRDGSLYDVANMVTFGGRPLADEDLQRAFPEAVVKTMDTTPSFAVVAVGDVDDDGGKETLDVWTIDASKRLENLANDCAD